MADSNVVGGAPFSEDADIVIQNSAFVANEPDHRGLRNRRRHSCAADRLESPLSCRLPPAASSSCRWKHCRSSRESISFPMETRHTSSSSAIHSSRWTRDVAREAVRSLEELISENREPTNSSTVRSLFGRNNHHVKDRSLRIQHSLDEETRRRHQPGWPCPIKRHF